MVKFYAGIGSRQTPVNILEFFTRLAARMEINGWTLRSGGAEGADAAFATGCLEREIYLPWKGFNGLSSAMPFPSLEAEYLAATLHPTWSRLSQGARKLMARNCYQILGADLASPVNVVLCWTPDGCESHATRSQTTGGTGQAISLASRHGIPVINFFNPGSMDRLRSIVAPL